MKFQSVRKKSPPVSFRDSLFRGIAPDGGLYVPESIPFLPRTLLDRIADESLHSVGEKVLTPYIDDIPPANLRTIVSKALNFPIPLVQLQDGIYLLELFHGPTLAFKDVGARFMANASSYFLSQEKKELTILVATSGDTGSAVAHGFHNVPHVTVYILYPSGQISKLQEQQMTTLGGNIRALEVKGTFDDCQALVKQALVDEDLLAAHGLTTANSMNMGRLLPQIVYYVSALSQLAQNQHGSAARPTLVVPSGNFGNLTAAAYAKRMGAPIGKLVAATNANDVVPKYLQSGVFTPKPSLRTLSNAMDVGNPSNFARLQNLYDDNIDRMREDIEAIPVSDPETLEEIRATYRSSKYILDPHTAVGVAAARKVMARGGNQNPIIVAATAHPAKFPEIVEGAIKEAVPLPAALKEALARPKQSTPIRANYGDLKDLLLAG
ncbi:MAG TPA: threonine synthase [Bacteroidota bacterium]|jgi:threonine synthase